MIRANLLSEGQSNGFPTYRLKWQGVGTLHRRFKGCNDQVRATPYERGSDERIDNAIDAISGATITGDGVTDMIYNRLQYYIPYLKQENVKVALNN